MAQLGNWEAAVRIGQGEVLPQHKVELPVVLEVVDQIPFPPRPRPVRSPGAPGEQVLRLVIGLPLHLVAQVEEPQQGGSASPGVGGIRGEVKMVHLRHTQNPALKLWTQNHASRRKKADYFWQGIVPY